jgi:hypothetical protein
LYQAATNRFVFIKNSFLSHEEKIIITTKGVKRYFLSTFLVIIIGFLGSAGFFINRSLMVIVDRFIIIYRLLVAFAFFTVFF